MTIGGFLGDKGYSILQTGFETLLYLLKVIMMIPEPMRVLLTLLVIFFVIKLLIP